MRSPRTPAIAATLALLALALGLAACGEKSEDSSTGGRSRSSLTLDFYPNPDHAGIYMAQKLGYFEEAGLDVEIQTPVGPGGADQAGRRRPAPTWRSPTSPRWCWPTSRASTWSRSGPWSTGR